MEKNENILVMVEGDNFCLTAGGNTFNCDS